MTANTAVFTDLDGSLLDHDNYSFAPAAEALATLDDQQIPWILNTSKTAAELAELRQHLNNPYPYIVENGAAVVFPENAVVAEPEGLESSPWGKVKALAPGRQHILRVIRDWREEHGPVFTGFSDMDAPKVCELTGLPPEGAVLALQREYSEPIVWQGSGAHWQAFSDMLAAEGLQALRGGRFTHIIGDCDKGRAMRWLAPRLIPGCTAPRCIALGDGENDVAMLALADEGVIIRSAHHEPPLVPAPSGRIHITDECGPAGWNSSLLALL